MSPRTFAQSPPYHLVASSLGVYIGRAEIPWREELALPAVPVPHLIVAFKKTVEPLAMHALPGSGVQPAVLRIGSVWGPLMDPDSPFNPIPPYINAALRGERPPAVPADSGGATCYAADAGSAIARLTTAPTLRHEIYNVSSGRPYTNRELSEAVRKAIPGANPELLPEHPAGAGVNCYLDISRLVSETGFAPSFTLTTAVADYVAWRADNAR